MIPVSGRLILLRPASLALEGLCQDLLAWGGLYTGPGGDRESDLQLLSQWGTENRPKSDGEENVGSKATR